MKKFLSALTAIVMLMGTLAGIPAFSEENETLPTLAVNMTEEDHPILHGSAGFLYGISNEGVPDVNTLTPLKPKVLATKGALGTEHPYGDALDVADEFFEAGGEQVQMYTSNYYGVFGVTADANSYGDVLRTIIAPAVAQWKDERREKFPDIDSRIVYIPINEGTPVNGVANFNEAWKIYYDSIKAADPTATIAGPNDAVYRGHSSMRDFLRYCRDNDCLPDIITWHELQVSCLNTMKDHIADYRNICVELGIEEKQVVINEYADYADCGVPGRLVNWIARLEDNQVYGCLPFWHQANNLNDLTASANQGNGAWWVYKWYGEMSGQTLGITTKNTNYDGFYGLAAIDENKRSAAVLCGGTDGSAVVRLENIADTSVFRDADKVNVKVEATYFTGYHGASYGPETVMEGVFAVEDGAIEIRLDDMLFSNAYYITVTEADSEVTTPTVGDYRAVYEAEDAMMRGDLIIDKQNSPLETPRYFCSGGVRVGGIDSEGEGIEYNIDVPVDGLYKLSFIYGNGVGSTRNNASTHRPLNITQNLIVDGTEEEILLPNTLFYSMEGSVDKYVSLTAGRHRVALMYSGDAGAFHDALCVSYAGAYGEERPVFNKRYEAEAADFGIPDEGSAARTENEAEGFSGSSYVAGLEEARVESGGGIRWVVDVEESGFYHLNYRYLSDSDGSILVYLDNTNLTFINLAAEVPIAQSEAWSEAHATIFLRQGINIIDIGTTCPAAVDYMQVIKAELDYSQTIEAEDAEGEFETAVSGENVYVGEMLANEQYLEFSVTVPEDGDYKMQVFQSNNDLCGTHSYNIKIIDRYAVFEVNGEIAGRYFFPNTFSDDTFLERTITLSLNAGENKIKVYNDDSWQVFWGGSQSEPGTNRLINYTPNFDKFIISPAAVQSELTNTENVIDVSFTDNGYAYSSRNTAIDGETVTIYLVPDGKIKRLTVNGEDITERLRTEDGTIYTAEIEISGETSVFAEFAEAVEGGYDEVIFNNGYVSIDGENYKILGENLFKNGDFTDSSGENMEHWYVGVNTGGHPTGGNYQIPKINPDGSLENLIRLTDSGLLTMGGYELDAPDTFYYGADGSRNYLVEHMGSDWHNCAWNGAWSILAYVPIKPDTKYCFRFSAYTVSGRASVRYGAINMENYVPEVYSTGDSLNFSGTGYMDCTNGDMQNVGGGWQDYEAIIDSADGDYFLFNAYWLQMAEYLCLGGFELYELADEPATELFEIKSLPAMNITAGDELSLTETVSAETVHGETVELPVTWLNAAAVNTEVPNVYAVTGYVALPDNLYYSGDLYVRQRVIVSPAFPAEITGLSAEGNTLTCRVRGNENCDGLLFAVGKDSDGTVTWVKSSAVTIIQGDETTVELELEETEEPPREVFLWEKDSLRPLTAKKTV